MPTDIGTQFDFTCAHTPACPSWWNCERRGSYEDAKARYADSKPPVGKRSYELDYSTDGRVIDWDHKDYYRPDKVKL